MVRVLIIGADGTLGQALAAALEARGDTVIRTSRRADAPEGPGWLHLDLADPASVGQPLPDIDVAVICAAMARYADCRETPELARQINVTAPAALTARVAAAGGRPVLLSTSAVFDCIAPRMPANAPVTPTSDYGRLKAEAEAAVLAHAPAGTVLRLTKVLTPDMPLIAGWIAALQAGQPVEAFADVTIAPLSPAQVVAALLAVIDDPAGPAIRQISGPDDISYARIAGHLAHRLGADPALVRRVSARDRGIPEDQIARFTSLAVTPDLAGIAVPARDLIDRIFGPALQDPARSAAGG